MSIQTAIENAQQKVENAYTAVQNKGGTMPATQNLSNLPTAINSITTSGAVEELNVTPTTSAQTITPSAGVDGFNPVKVAAVTSAIDSDIKASNIKSGVNILGVNGSVVELNGETKSVSLTSSSGQTFTPSSGKNAITSITVTPNNQARTVTPTTSQQSLTVNSGYSGNGTITVNAVTSAIDSDIQAGNIKSGVNILGVSGSLIPLSSTTLSVSQNGTYTPVSPYNGYSSVVVNVSGGNGQYLVQVIDYDGTVLKSDRLNAGDSFTLPSAPSHAGLVFQEWSSPVTITNNTITVADSDIIIGAIYTTSSGLSEFDITLNTVTGLNVTLNMDGTKNWGDGTSDTATSHTYSSAGNYTITCDGTTISSPGSQGLFGQSSGDYIYFVTNIRFANIAGLGPYSLQYCSSLKTITIPKGVTNISSDAFKYCESLIALIIPSGVMFLFATCGHCYSLIYIVLPYGLTFITIRAFEYCYSLKSITIPSTVTTLSNYAFTYCYSLNSLTIPASISSIGANTLENCFSLNNLVFLASSMTLGSAAIRYNYSLKKLKLPKTSSIAANAFNGNRACIEYDFTKNTSVPTLSNANAFTDINGICKIKVPSNLVASWKTASNWSTYANYIVGV